MSALDDVTMLSSDSRANTLSFETALEEAEAALDAQKKAVQFSVPKDPIIGVPPGTVLSAMDESGMLGDDLAGNGAADDDGAATEEEDRSRGGEGEGDDSLGGMEDMVGELDDSAEEGSGEFV